MSFVGVIIERRQHDIAPTFAAVGRGWNAGIDSGIFTFGNTDLWGVIVQGCV